MARPVPLTNLGRADHLPEAVSGQNNVWYWGPGNSRATTVVAVVQGPLSGGAGSLLSQLHHDFAKVRSVATIRNREGLTNQEEGGHIEHLHRTSALMGLSVVLWIQALFLTTTHKR